MGCYITDHINVMQDLSNITGKKKTYRISTLIYMSMFILSIAIEIGRQNITIQPDICLIYMHDVLNQNILKQFW
jgi:hypothetical protein